MTLTELFILFDRRRRLFFGTMAFAIVVAMLVYYFQIPRYTHELLLSVTRTSVATTPEYAYDHFYRLQADERMAESLTRYLESETGKRAVAERAKLEPEAYREYTKAKLRVIRLGSNGVRLDYVTKDVASGGVIGEALSMTANEYVFALNEDARQKEWFTVVNEKPVTHSANWHFSRFLCIGLVVGLLLGFWTVVLQYFWQNYQKQKTLSLKKEV